MSVRYDKLVPALKALLPDDSLDALGRVVAFIRRLRAIRASAFVWSVVLSRFGTGRPGFEQARRWYHLLASHELWPRPFQMRFKSAATVRLFERAFENAVRGWRRPTRARHPLARHFADVAIVDSSLVQLADELRPVFKGARGMAATLKVLLTISIFGLLPLHGQLVAGNRHDMTLFPPLDALCAGTLMLFDKGFVAYDRLRQIRDAGHHYLCPMRSNGNAIVVRAHRAPAYVHRALRRHPEGVWLRDLLPANKRIGKAWDLDVLLWPKTQARSRQEVSSRLVLMPGPKQAQRPYLTDLERASWSPRTLAELYRLRWQIELVFKELKQHLNLEALNSNDQYAIQVFAWASLIALALSRTITNWLCPRIYLAGLQSGFRPALTTRALRGTVRLLAHVILAPPRKALQYLELLAEDLLVEVCARDHERDDSFKRLVPLLAVA